LNPEPLNLEIRQGRQPNSATPAGGKDLPLNGERRKDHFINPKQMKEIV
jgi:hypothetical protein